MQRHAIQQDIRAAHHEAAKAGTLDDVIAGKGKARAVELGIIGGPQADVRHLHSKEEHVRFTGMQADASTAQGLLIEQERPALIDHVFAHVGELCADAQRRLALGDDGRQPQTADVPGPRQLLHPDGAVDSAVAEPVEVRRGNRTDHVVGAVHAHNELVLAGLRHRDGEAER